MALSIIAKDKPTWLPLAKLSSNQTGQMIEVVLDLPYNADPLLEPELVGLTNAQVMVFRMVQKAANGSSDAFDRIMDRLVGKPVSTSKNLNVQTSYEDFLKTIATKPIDVSSKVVIEDL